ncbi:hypothetical protein HD553DRAFT_351428 [Filobasidium floriforme]|uniref:uncharacterized protein n=1 Tax=Filobasidium floriforme TaxID=5210 RepID=UPI001E8E4BD7|nr:uncharacterized protein HD553DRAFT_351428 [Filobasidium floriforme]KAH8081905.1 hypothetical protein HD553DRAFT_351428 [Filobasidium floriforme]
MTSTGAILLVISFLCGQALAATTSEVTPTTLIGAATATVTRYVKEQEDENDRDDEEILAYCLFGVMGVGGTILLLGSLYTCCNRFRGRRNTPTPGCVEAQSHATPNTSEDVPPYEKAQNEAASSASKLGEAPPYSLPDDQSVSVPTAQLSSPDVEKHDCQESTESSLEATNVQSISYSVSASDAASIHGEKQEQNENMQVR